MPTTTVFPNALFRRGFSGTSTFATNLASGYGTAYSFPFRDISLDITENSASPILADSSSIPHNRVLGLTLGQLMQSGPVMPDRGWAGFLTDAFGPRTNGFLPPFGLTLEPSSGDTSATIAGVYWQKSVLEGRFSQRGDEMLIGYQAHAIVLDPANVSAISPLTAAAGTGLAGAGLSSFAACSVLVGSAAADGMRSFRLTLDNRTQVQPAMADTTHRISAGATPGPIGGELVLTQLRGAASPLPSIDGVYGITLTIPTGDGSHILTLALSVEYESAAQRYQAADFNQQAYTYSLFGTSTGNATNSAGYPFVASYE